MVRIVKQIESANRNKAIDHIEKGTANDLNDIKGTSMGEETIGACPMDMVVIPSIIHKSDRLKNAYQLITQYLCEVFSINNLSHLLKIFCSLHEGRRSFSCAS